MPTAVEDLDALMSEPNRCAVLRKELVARSSASARTCDRVLQRYCAEEKLTRVSHGIYGIGQARVFDIVPEVMPKLGFEILGKQQVKGYSQKSSGRVWQLDRPSSRNVRRKGVRALFQTRQDGFTNLKRRGMNQNKPTKQLIDDHYHKFDAVHSRARAEKDLIVQHALTTLTEFKHQDAELAIDGGTSLVYYYGLFSRFSEDIDVRVVLNPKTEDLSDEKRVQAVKDIGTDFRSHVETCMPYLRATKKGRVRRDAVVQALIYDYDPEYLDDEVVAGIKFELVNVPLQMPLNRTSGKTARFKDYQAVDYVEIASGKYQALASYLPDRQDSYRQLVRHVHDLAAMEPILSRFTETILDIFEKVVVSEDSLRATLKELEKPVWADHYDEYMEKMMMTRNPPVGSPEWVDCLRAFSNLTSAILAGWPEARKSPTREHEHQ